MMTLIEEKYYKDITAIRQSLERIARTLETRVKAAIAAAVAQRLLDPAAAGDPAHRKWMINLTEQLTNDIIRKLTDNGKDNE